MKSKKTIFILEDEIDLNEMIAIELESRGYETSTFYNPKDFCKNFSEMKPDLLITDLRLPEVSGIEIIKMVKKMDVYNLPIITITAYNDVPAHELYQLGVESVIYKPFQLLFLATTIERLCTPLENRLQMDIENQGQYSGWIRKLDENKIDNILIGRGGFSFSTEEKIGNHEIVEFSIQAKNQNVHPITGKGIIRWDITNIINKEQKMVNKYGVEFVYLDDESKEYILSLRYNNIIPYIPYDES
ncbi:MAG: response regulator [Candidatus Hydrogenedens sp.]